MRLLIALALVLSSALALAADDTDREIARKRYEMGTLLYSRGRYAEALVELQAARSIVDRPEMDYNIGLCLAKLDRPVEAADALERFVRARPDDAEAPAIRQRIIELRGQLAHPPLPLVTETHPPLPPVAAPEPIRPPPPPTPPASTPPGPPAEPIPPGVTAAPERHESGAAAFIRTGRGVGAVLTGSVAVGALLIAAITGGVALSKRDTYDTSCAFGHCNRDAYDDAHTLAVTTDVMLGVSVAAAVTSGILILTRPKERKVAVVPTGLGVAGVF